MFCERMLLFCGKVLRATNQLTQEMNLLKALLLLSTLSLHTRVVSMCIRVYGVSMCLCMSANVCVGK